MSQIPIRVNRVILLMCFLFDDKEGKSQHSDNVNVMKKDTKKIFLHNYVSVFIQMHFS